MIARIFAGTMMAKCKPIYKVEGDKMIGLYDEI